MGGDDQIQAGLIAARDMGFAFLKHFLVSDIDVAESGRLSALGDGLDIAQRRVEPSRLLIGLNVAAPHGEDRFDVQNISDLSDSRRNPAALYQIFEIVHHKIDIQQFDASFDIRSGLFQGFSLIFQFNGIHTEKAAGEGGA